MALSQQDFEAWLASDTSIRCTLAEIEVYDTITSSVQTLYLSTKNYVTASTDTPANTIYLPVLATSVAFTETLDTQGAASINYGSISIENYNGEFDSWTTNYIWTNRPVRLYFGDVRFSRDNFTLIFSGTIADLTSVNSTQITVAIADLTARFNAAVSEELLGNYFQGNIVPTSTYDNPNKDEIKPLVFGEVHNITPLLMDATELEFMVHNGPIESIIEIRDNGVPLAPGTGYTVNLSAGTFKLLVNPAGAITCSVQGDAFTVNSSGDTVPGYSNRVTRLIQRILTGYGKTVSGVPQDPLQVSEMDLTALNAFDSAHTQAVGIYISQKENILDVCNQLAQSVGASVVASRLGKVSLVKLQTPAGGTFEISGDRMLINTLEMTRQLPVQAAVKLGYCKNYTLQEGLLTGVPQSNKDLYATPWLVRSVTDSTTRTIYKLGTEPAQIDTLLLTDAAGEVTAEATRLLSLYKTQRRVFRFVGTQELITLRVGDMVVLKHYRYGLSSGVQAQVLLSEINWDSGLVTLEVLV